MTDVEDIDLFGDHDKTDTHLDKKGKIITLTPGGAMGGATWEPEHKQETSFRRTSLREEVLKERVKGLYQKLTGKHW